MSVKSKPAIPFAEFVVLMAMITSGVAFSIDAMLPALPAMRADLNVLVTYDSQLMVAMLMLGLGVGQLLFGPMTDRFGRRPIFLVGCVVFVTGSVICLCAQDLWTMLLGRLIQGLGAAAPRICSQAMIRDQYQGEAMARVMSLTSMVFILIPMIAPAIGQWLLHVGSWQLIFVVLIMMSLTATSWLWIRQPETLAVERRRPMSLTAIGDGLLTIMGNRRVLGCILAMGLNFGAFLAYLGTSEKLLIGLYDVGAQFALYFALLAMSVGVASFTNASLVMKLGMARLIRVAQLTIFVFSLLLLLVWSHSQGLPPLWQTMGLLMVILFGVGILFGNLGALAMQPLGKMAGLGAAVVGFLSSLLSVLISIIISAGLESSYQPVAIGFCVCAFLGVFAIRWAIGSTREYKMSVQAP